MQVWAVKAELSHPRVTGANLLAVLQCKTCVQAFNLVTVHLAPPDEATKRARQDPRHILNSLQAAIDEGHTLGHVDSFLTCDEYGRILKRNV